MVWTVKWDHSVALPQTNCLNQQPISGVYLEDVKADALADDHNRLFTMSPNWKQFLLQWSIDG